MSLLKKLFGKPSMPNLRQKPSKKYIECVKGSLRHNPVLLPLKSGEKLLMFESSDGAVIRFAGKVGCLKCKKMLDLSFDTVLPKHWDEDKLTNSFPDEANAIKLK